MLQRWHTARPTCDGFGGTIATMAHPLDAAVGALAGRQWGVCALAQMMDLGMPPTTVQTRAADGRLHRLYRGVYSLVPADLLTRNGRWLAAVLACGPRAVLSHRTAAALHELRGTAAVLIDVTVPGRSNRTHRGLRVHRSVTLTDKDVTVAQGIPVTSIARTQLDLAEMVNRRGVERALDQAEAMNVFDLRALEDQIARNATRPAARVLRSVLREHYIGSTLTWSELEERFLAVVRRHGLPQPELNRFVDLGDGEPPVRADFVWRTERILVETDGYKTHKTRQAFEYDRRLSQRAMVAGWQPVRTTARQLEHHPEQVVATVEVLMRRS